MNNEYIEIAQQLRLLADRLERLAAAQNTEQPEPVEQLVSEPAPEPAPAATRFTLNDRFRFQRELFGGSAAAMDSLVSRMDAAPSEADVQALFDAEIARPADDPTAADFLYQVTLRFNNKLPLMH